MQNQVSSHPVIATNATARKFTKLNFVRSRSSAYMFYERLDCLGYSKRSYSAAGYILREGGIRPPTLGSLAPSRAHILLTYLPNLRQNIARNRLHPVGLSFNIREVISLRLPVITTKTNVSLPATPLVLGPFSSRTRSMYKPHIYR